MNKKQLPEDIMSKIEQEANTYASKNCHGPEWGYDNHSDLETGYIAGRTASVQPLIDVFRNIMKWEFAMDGRKFDGNHKEVLKHIIKDIVMPALSSFPSSPSNTGEWISLEENNFEVDKPYLLHGTDWPYPVVGEYWKIPGDTGWHEKSSGHVLFNVSHFQSLPEPPKQ